MNPAIANAWAEDAARRAANARAENAPEAEAEIPVNQERDMKMLNKLPEFVRALPDDEVPEAAVRWSGKADPPAIGERFNIRVNGIGPAVAVGYYVDSGWLGVMCDVEKWPPYFEKANGDNMRCGVFGAEIG